MSKQNRGRDCKRNHLLEEGLNAKVGKHWRWQTEAQADYRGRVICFFLLKAMVLKSFKPEVGGIRFALQKDDSGCRIKNGLKSIKGAGEAPVKRCSSR